MEVEGLERICNAYEPDNVGVYTWRVGEDEAYKFSCHARFRDGTVRCGIVESPAGGFDWWRDDDETGHVTTWSEAWDQMPAMIAEPDYREPIGESRVVLCEPTSPCALCKCVPDRRSEVGRGFRSEDGRRHRAIRDCELRPGLGSRSRP